MEISRLEQPDLTSFDLALGCFAPIRKDSDLNWRWKHLAGSYLRSVRSHTSSPYRLKVVWVLRIHPIANH